MRTEIDPFALRALLGATAAPCRRAITGEHGVALPGFFDHHVHLHLIDESELPAHGIAAVVDLGGDPVELARRPKDGIPRVVYAGAFLTVPGGYPSGRPWAPSTVVREVRTASPHAGAPGGAATAVDEQAAFGASAIKVALNANVGPVFDAPTLATIVASARTHKLPVVAHVEGDGMTQLAVDAVIDALAHTPFTERVSPDLIARAASRGQVWISTLAIHEGQDAETALANARDFVAAGGSVRYGTDLGNGERPVGIQTDELELLHAAGVQGSALIKALASPWPLTDRSKAVATFVPGLPPETVDDIPAWLGGAVVVPDEELVRDDN